jgi:chromosome segregation ATPase
MSFTTRTIHVFLALGMTVAASGTAQSQDTYGVACLRAEQRAELANLARKLIADLRIQEEIDSLKNLLDQGQAPLEVALDCKRRLESAFETLQATFEGCPGKIDQYNRNTEELNAKKESVSTRQEMVRTQIQLHRSKFPPC